MVEIYSINIRKNVTHILNNMCVVIVVYKKFIIC